MTAGYSLPITVKRATDLLLFRNPDRNSLGALAAIMIIAVTVPLTVLSLAQSYTVHASDSPQLVAAYLAHNIAPDKVIETYESELMFLSNRRFHYPPDQVHVALAHRLTIDKDYPVDYDPLIADPDYLVVGYFSHRVGLYEDVLASGEFSLLETFTRYFLYQRNR